MPVREKPISPEFFNFDDHTLRVVEREFMIKDLDAFYPLLLDGQNCTLLEIRSETSRKAVVGATGSSKRYFLKQVPWYCDDQERLSFSHAFQSHLTSASQPVPRLHLTQSGGTWVEVRDAKFVLFDFVAAERFAGNILQVRGAAEGLARIHTVVYPEDVRLAEPQDLFSFARDHVDLLRDAHRFDDMLAVKSLVDDLYRRVESLYTKAIELGWATLPSQPVHGDYSPWNVLFEADGSIAAILDFDNCDFGPVIHDVAEGLVTFCAVRYRQDSTNFAGSPTCWDFDRGREFLASYERIRPLSAVEVACVPILVDLILTEFLCLGLVRRDLTLAEVSEYVQFLSNVQSHARECFYS